MLTVKELEAALKAPMLKSFEDEWIIGFGLMRKQAVAESLTKYPKLLDKG